MVAPAAAPVVAPAVGLSPAAALLGLGGVALGGTLLYFLLRPKRVQAGPMRPGLPGYGPDAGYGPNGGYAPGGYAPGGRPALPGGGQGPSDAQLATGLVAAGGGALAAITKGIASLFGGGDDAPGGRDSGVIDTREEWDYARRREAESQAELDRQMREILDARPPQASAWDFGPPAPPSWELDPEGWLGLDGVLGQDWSGFSPEDLNYLALSGQISQAQYEQAMIEAGYGDEVLGEGISFGEDWMNDADDVPPQDDPYADVYGFTV